MDVLLTVCSIECTVSCDDDTMRSSLATCNESSVRDSEQADLFCPNPRCICPHGKKRLLPDLVDSRAGNRAGKIFPALFVRAGKVLYTLQGRITGKKSLPCSYH